MHSRCRSVSRFPPSLTPHILCLSVPSSSFSRALLPPLGCAGETRWLNGPRFRSIFETTFFPRDSRILFVQLLEDISDSELLFVIFLLIRSCAFNFMFYISWREGKSFKPRKTCFLLPLIRVYLFITSVEWFNQARGKYNRIDMLEKVNLTSFLERFESFLENYNF